MPVDQAVKEEQIRLAEELLFSGARLPSFAKGLYAGLFDAARVFPFPQPGPEEARVIAEFNDRLNAFMDAHLDPDAIDRNADIPGEVIKGLFDIGLLSCTIDPQYGGQGFSQIQYCKAVEQVARRCGSTALFVNVQQSIGMKALLLYGSEDQKNTWLPRLARGEAIAAFALTEMHAGSDAANVQTRAVFDAARNVWVINGTKQWITNGAIADVLTVMARTEVDGEDRITAFLVTPDMPGFKVTVPALEKVGMRGTRTAKLAFKDMEVPAANILGELGRGLHVALHVLDFGRTTFGATCTGAAKYCVERAIEHVRNRVQFKQPIANFDLVKDKIARMTAYAYAMEAMTQLTAGLVDRGEEDYMLETAMLKVFASEQQWDILYDTMQLFGGRSFFTDEPFERMMRDARLNPIGEGSNDVLRVFIGLVGMRDVGMQFKEVADTLTRPGMFFGKVFGLGKDSMRKLLVTPTVPVRAPELQEEARQLGDRIRKFGLAVQRLIVHYKEAILDAQMELNRVADAAMALYGMTAVLGRLDSELAHNGRETADLAVGKLYCALALDTIDRALGGLMRNHDDAVRDVARRLTGF
ncbi:MAG TPA: acyl-CoA dehydrogenase family protein [Candidatus Hydrogenedentes bacterium]|nr:acyl-CoA dehydrogenase family protein [Candidatus Hydrogenedentota bacterium]HNT86545.1 acyl-CoA dehydrogenase family protein [Candidatus Hydrogenedentota bacterium]